MREQGWNGRGGFPSGKPLTPEQMREHNRIRRIIISGGNDEITAKTPIIRIIEIKPPKKEI